jgi:tetratricopeptide (TPR) repeat protein
MRGKALYMIGSMNNRFKLSLLLSLALTSCVWSNEVNAAVPPTKDKVKDFDKPVESTPSASRFHRRMDYRDEEKLKAAELEAAKKAAVEQQQRAELAATQSVKKQAQASIDANNRGVAMGQAHRWLEAISAHEQACQLDPRNKQFRINLSAARTAYGQEKMAAGDLSAASNLFRKALSAASDNGMAAKLLVECMKKQGKNPSDVETRLDLGEQLCSINDFESASVEFQAAMQLEPSARTFIKMGDMSLRYGQVSTAASWYQQAIVKDPNFGPAHRQMGLLALAQRDYTGAAASLRKAVILDPKDVAAGEALVQIWRRQVAQNPNLAENHLGLAGALQLTGDFIGAESEYRKLEALDPRNPSLEAGRNSLQRAIIHAEADKHRAAAETFHSQGLNKEALAEITRAVQMEPKNPKFHFLLAECLESSGNFEMAHKYYMACVINDQENAKEAAIRMKDIQKRLGDRVDTSSQANEIANQFGRNTAQAAPQNQSVAERSDASQSVSQAPVQNTRTANGGMGEIMSKVAALEADKNLDAAIQILRGAVQVDLKNADLHHRLAVDLLANGQISEAISEFRMSSALRPENQDYAADLARAMQIHKTALQSTSGVATTAEVAK